MTNSVRHKQFFWGRAIEAFLNECAGYLFPHVHMQKARKKCYFSLGTHHHKS